MDYPPILQTVKQIHFVGIGGISMSALAKLALHNGIRVSGSDLKKTDITDELQKLGATIFIGHNKQNIGNCDLLIYTIAVGEKNPEVVLARALNIMVMERADFLHEISLNYAHTIAVAGTHGKTTTCGMLASVFIAAGFNPTVHIGGECSCTHGNLRIGGNEFFITEACEYQRHMLKIPHAIGIILNIEYDHPDYYKNLIEVGNAFNSFALQSKEKTIIDENYKIFLSDDNGQQVESFGLDGKGNWIGKNIRQYRKGEITFTCFHNGAIYGNFKLHLFGKHNVKNALAVIAVADHFHIPLASIQKGLSCFYGVKRRYEFMGLINDCPVIHDYAHHPTQIQTVLETTKQIFKRPIICVFQPHTFSRTINLFTDFVKSFAVADELILLPTYAAREKPIKHGTAKDLFQALEFHYKNAVYFHSFETALRRISKKRHSVILILGAGDIIDLAQKIKAGFTMEKNCLQ